MTRLVLTLLVYFSKLTGLLAGGYPTRFHHFDFSEKSKNSLVMLHILSSFILAFGITNNYLVNVQVFHEHFEKNTLWLIGAAFVLLVILLIVIGSLITLLTSRVANRPR